MPDHLRQNIIFLRQATNRFLLTGEVLHRAISAALEQFSPDAPARLADFINSAWEEFSRRVEFSRQKKFLYHDNRETDFTLLWETVYETPLTAALLAQCYQKLKTALRNFWKLSRVESIRNLPEGAVLEKERLDSSRFQGAKLWSKIDLLYREGGRYHLVDWKLSRFDRQADALQLAIYALRISEKHQLNGKSLELTNVYLLENEEVRYPAGAEMLSEARLYIENSLEMLAAAEKEWRRDGLLAFPAKFRPRSCRYCNFRNICFPDGLPYRKRERQSEHQI